MPYLVSFSLKYFVSLFSFCKDRQVVFRDRIQVVSVQFQSQVEAVDEKTREDDSLLLPPVQQKRAFPPQRRMSRCKS